MSEKITDINLINEIKELQNLLKNMDIARKAWQDKQKELSEKTALFKIGDKVKNKNSGDVFIITKINGSFNASNNNNFMFHQYHGNKILKNGTIGTKDFYIGYSEELDKNENLTNKIVWAK